MNTVILGGPALALDNSVKTRHYTIISTDDLKQIASIVVDMDKKVRSLFIHCADQTEEITSAVCKLLRMVALNHETIPITANDMQGISLAYLLSGNVASSDPDIVAAWTSLDFELTLTNSTPDGVRNSVRFSGANMAGIKKIAKASNVTLTAKKKRVVK